MSKAWTQKQEQMQKGKRKTQSSAGRFTDRSEEISDRTVNKRGHTANRSGQRGKRPS